MWASGDRTSCSRRSCSSFVASGSSLCGPETRSVPRVRARQARGNPRKGKRDARRALELLVHGVPNDGKDLRRIKDVQPGVDLVAEELFRPFDPVPDLARLAVDHDAAKLLRLVTRDLDGHDSADAAVRGVELLEFGERPVADNVRVKDKDLVRVALEDDIAVVVQAAIRERV